MFFFESIQGYFNFPIRLIEKKIVSYWISDINVICFSIIYCVLKILGSIFYSN